MRSQFSRGEMAHAARVLTARMSPDGKYLATASADNLVKVWNVADLLQTSDVNAVYATR